jgi:hypothetical protein
LNLGCIIPCSSGVHVLEKGVLTAPDVNVWL